MWQLPRKGTNVGHRELLAGLLMIAILMLILAAFGGVPPEFAGARGR